MDESWYSDLMKVLSIVTTIIAYAILVPLAYALVIIWFSVTWPWYIWRGIHRIAHPR